MEIQKYQLDIKLYFISSNFFLVLFPSSFSFLLGVFLNSIEGKKGCNWDNGMRFKTKNEKLRIFILLGKLAFKSGKRN